MKQKFYTLEESVLEKSTDSPRPKRKRHARASPRMPASAISSESADNPTTQYEPQASLFKPSASDNNTTAGTEQEANNPNHWVYSANTPRKGDVISKADSDADYTVELSLPEEENAASGLMPEIGRAHV